HGVGAINIDATKIGEGDGGRWPTNAILDEDAAAWLDAESGARGAAAPASGPIASGRSTSDSRGAFNGTDEAPAFYGDKGGASRFFYVA
ncbi:hypothetical protein N4308_14630, partial [Staphylococcus aureus]|uniref:hypothetical protein n=1 Tax=Staphylococcus aureus TaxID=1280 RepID=UPI0021B0FB04